MSIRTGSQADVQKLWIEESEGLELLEETNKGRLKTTVAAT
jgi:hypothetical protein